MVNDSSIPNWLRHGSAIKLQYLRQERPKITHKHSIVVYFQLESQSEENLNSLTDILVLFSFQVNGTWALPSFVCDFYIAMDVTCSTSSIFNLVAISIDRWVFKKQKKKRESFFLFTAQINPLILQHLVRDGNLLNRFSPFAMGIDEALPESQLMNRKRIQYRIRYGN